MNETPQTKSRWRILRRLLIALAVLATLAAIFYTEENWRGKRAWEECQRRLEAQGMVLDWDVFIPPPVPDGQNFFMAPQMAAWFTGRNTTNDLYLRLRDKKYADISASVGTSNLVSSAVLAREYLAWSDQFKPDFELLREALKRPYAQMGGDYGRPYEITIPNFVTVRALAQTLCQRAHCYFLLNQPESALAELTLLNDARRLLENGPTGKPMTLVAAMINVAVAGIYAQTVAEGFQRNSWQSAEFVALQEQVAKINLVPLVVQAIECEPAAICRTAEITPAAKIFNMGVISGDPPKKKGFLEKLWIEVKSLPSSAINLTPRGWIFQNMVVYATQARQLHDGMFDSNQRFTPQRLSLATKQFEVELAKKSRFNVLLRIGMPNFSKALQVLAKNQTMVNEAQIVCALERYRFAHGGYPETLAELEPQFLLKLPPDLVGGQPLHYRRTEDGKFLLYSVGWNETDDGGVTANGKDGQADMAQGDWVWPYALK